MSKPDAPTPPNPYATAAAQTGTNVSTAVANSFLNNMNQVTPTGNLNYDVTGNYNWTDPSTGSTYSIPRFTATQNLTDQGRAIQNQNLGAQYNLAGMSNAQSGRISGLLSQEMNLSGAPAAGNASAITNVPGAQTSYNSGGAIQSSLGDYGQQQSTFGDAGDITRSYGPADNFSADRQRVEDSLMARMQPQLSKDRSAIEQRLADQGIRYGSQAYASAMDDYNRQSNDARFAAIGQAGSEQARMNDMAAKQAGFQNAAQMQAYQQAQGRGQFANDAQQQNYAQALGAGSFANAAQQQQNAQNASQAGFYNAGVGQNLAQAQSGFNAQNAQRNQYLQEQYQQRNQPINEISALLGQTQVQNPALTSTGNNQIPTTDIGGLINQNFAQQSQNYQSANQNWQATMGGLLGLGGKLGGAAIIKSDERVKDVGPKMGTVFAAAPDGEAKELPIYQYAYKDDPAATTHVGPMAQDVERIDKSAVTTRKGVKHIYPAKVMGSILEGSVMAFDWGTLGMSGLLSPVDDKNVPASLKQRIALAMLMQKRAYPKTFGEGLSSIGDSIGDAMTMRGVYADAAAGEKAGVAAEDQYRSGSPSTTTSSVSAVPAATTVATRSIVQPPDELPVDERQSDEPGAPHRMPRPEAVQAWRNSTPTPAGVPPVPQPQQPPLLITSPVQPPPPTAARPATLPPPPPPPPPAGQPATDFSSRFQGAALQPPPGTPVMAAGDEPSAQERDEGRNMLAQALMQQQAARSASAARQAVVAGAQPAVPPPPVIPQAPPPPQAQIRSAPPPQAPQPQAVPPSQPPPGQGPGPGYVLTLGPKPVPPPTMTEGMQRIQNIVRNTPPAYREAVEARLKQAYADEQAKLAQQGVIYKDELTQRHELTKLQEEQRQKADADRRAALKDAQERTSGAQVPAPVDPTVLGTERSPQRKGFPDLPPKPAGVSEKDWADKHVPELIKANTAVEAALPDFKGMLKVINDARMHPGKDLGTGMMSGFAVPGTAAYDFKTINEQLKGKNFLAGYQKLKGTGPVSEIEGIKTESAQSNIDPKAGKEAYDRALQNLEDTVRNDMETLQRRTNRPVTAWQRSHDDPLAPDKGEVRGGFEYMGGDPKDKTNWKRVR